MTCFVVIFEDVSCLYYYLVRYDEISFSEKISKISKIYIIFLILTLYRLFEGFVKNKCSFAAFPVRRTFPSKILVAHFVVTLQRCSIARAGILINYQPDFEVRRASLSSPPCDQSRADPIHRNRKPDRVS